MEMDHLKSLLKSSNDDRILKRKFKSKKTQSLDSDFVKGPWSKVEGARVTEAVENYLLEKNIPAEDLQCLIHPRKFKSKYLNSNFFQDILDSSKVNRTLDQLYWFMSRRFSNLDSQGEKWTREEDSKLRFLVELKGHKWTDIQAEMNRKDCKVRWEKICRSDLGFKRGRWSKDEEEKFIAGKKELESKYNIQNPNDFNAWTELSLIVGTRSFMQCRNKFIHNLSRLDFNQEFKVTWTLEDDQILVSRLIQYCSNAVDDSEIFWNKIATKEWQPWTGAFLHRRWLKLKSRLPPSVKTFTDALIYVQENIREISNTKYMHRDFLTIYSSLDSQKKEWSVEDSTDLLSHLLTLYSHAQDEGEIDWDSLVFSSWDGDLLRKKWLEIKESLNVNGALTFSQAVEYCKENITSIESEKQFKTKEFGDNEVLEMEKEQNNSSIPSEKELKDVSKDIIKQRKRKIGGLKDTPISEELSNKKKNDKIKSASIIHDSSSDQEAAKTKKVKSKNKKKLKNLNIQTGEK